MQNVVWTKDAHEGTSTDESITFSSQEGVNINADIGLSFHIEPSLAPHLYLRFRKPTSSSSPTATCATPCARRSTSSRRRCRCRTSTAPARRKLVADVHEARADALGKDGFIIDQLTINGASAFRRTSRSAINRAMEATQHAIQAENRVRQVKAEAEQAITQAAARPRPRASARRARPTPSHPRTRRGEGQRDHPLLDARGTVLQYRALERWNGKLPVINGGGRCRC